MAPKQDEATVCATCFKHASEAQLQKCGGCKAVFYCDKDCQKADWNNHKKTCKSSTSDAGPSFSNGLPSINDFPGGTRAIPINAPLPGVIEIGPKMTVGEVLAAKPGDPPVQFKERMVQPTPKELHDHCVALMYGGKGGEQQNKKSKKKQDSEPGSPPSEQKE